MTMAGLPFFLASLYLTLMFAFVYSLLLSNFDRSLLRQTLRRWGKLLLLLVILGVVVQGLTAFG